jgi:GNAT superfamily N-acetyltransferase
MSTPSIHVTDLPASADIAFLEARIIEHNYAAASRDDGRGLAAFIHDDQGRILAGIAGYTWAGMAEIEFLWVDPAARGQGLGSQVLAAVEAEARARGCALIIASTYSFQAPDFYHQHGYAVVGQIADCPPGHTNYWLKKSLRAAQPETPGA